ncbi:THO complex subunit 6 homolog isoform X1 [Hydra vulgaris]|uniref:THO complex subunit 6 homolog isoform X1 n=1 Tax=Hydra vulgaris TaxID=6087 RepID=A0ABM4B6E9_HYDVU
MQLNLMFVIMLSMFYLFLTIKGEAQCPMCPGLYCGRIDKTFENCSLPCKACARGYRSNHYFCKKCDESLDFYSWLYLGFMALTVCTLNFFFIDVYQTSMAWRLHTLALFESVVSFIGMVLVFEPRGSFALNACKAISIKDWYTMFFNPTQDFNKKIYCTQEAIYPLYTSVYIYLLFCLLTMVFFRGIIMKKKLKNNIKSLYAGLYILPIVCALHTCFAGVIFYVYPYLVLCFSSIGTAVFLSAINNGFYKKLLTIRSVGILSLFSVAHGYGIVSVTEMKSPIRDDLLMSLTRKELYSTVFAQQFSPCGKYLVTGNNYGKIAVFNITDALSASASLKCKIPMHCFQAHESYIYCFVTIDKYLISGGSSEVQAWVWKDLIREKLPKPAWSIHPPSSNPFGVPETNALTVNQSNNTLILGCGDNNVYVYDIETRNLLKTIQGHSDFIHAVGYLGRSHQIISGGEDGFIKFWDERSYEFLEQIEPSKLETASRESIGHWVSCFDVDQTEEWMVCGGAAHSSVWHLRSKTATAVLPTPNSCTQVAKFEDDYILIAGSEPIVSKWSMNGSLRSTFPCTPDSVYSLEINRKLNRILSIAGSSYNIDISTNFEYKSFSLTFKD